ncbi:exodeoxyribonuclease VII small subunit [Marinobacterium sp. LSUCC0821]|jgi:exodeoxyribonuclease VII small subunit|uniref:exodeoxyribonuclease VII small subunit n=1 Tax=Marinobacterium sp. LSUCC0821 TaxID=2668067 RepID=UPI001451BEA2|nr:exodeoxyribonuclease VII small subunit [Marinobacterium sp. LSUCC0821]QJD72024.1 exodeoxyribonuclease VII small subunit [Marinobacterium sp. LSUCC0821]
MSDKKQASDFEGSLKRLEALVTEMEKGDLPIEEALKAFEEGIGLTRECQKILQDAEQKVVLLTEKAGQITEQPFVEE